RLQLSARPQNQFGAIAFGAVVGRAATLGLGTDIRRRPGLHVCIMGGDRVGVDVFGESRGVVFGPESQLAWGVEVVFGGAHARRVIAGISRATLSVATDRFDCRIVFLFRPPRSWIDLCDRCAV